MHTKTKTNKVPPQAIGVHHQQWNLRLRTASSLSYQKGGGLNAFYWRQFFVLDSVVVNTHFFLARMEAS